MFGLGMQELLIVGVVAVLLFGKRLPEVARSVGSSYREFRRGLNELQSQINVPETPRASKASRSYDDYSAYREEATAPKFEPPPAEPQVGNSAASDPATSEK